MQDDIKKGILIFLANRWLPRGSDRNELPITQTRSMTKNEIYNKLVNAEVLAGDLDRSLQSVSTGEIKVENPYQLFGKFSKRFAINEILATMVEENLLELGQGPRAPHFFITLKGAQHIKDEELVREFERLAFTESADIKTMLKAVKEGRMKDGYTGYKPHR